MVIIISALLHQFDTLSSHCASNDEECGFEPNDCSVEPVATILGALFEIGLEEGTIQAAGHKKGRKIGGCAKKCKKTGLFMDILALLGSDI